MYSKDAPIQRHDFSEVKAYSAAREVILKAEKHPVVKAYLKALKFVEEQRKCAKADEDGPRSPPDRFRNGNVVPAARREPDDAIQEIENARDGTAHAANTKQEEKQSNIIYLPLVTPDVRACARACGMDVEAYMKQIIQFANEAVKNEQARNIILNQ